jgi:iron-sulfur cluster repair protein YtfE (RIC family)
MDLSVGAGLWEPRRYYSNTIWKRERAMMTVEKKLSDISWKDFKALALRDKGAYFQAVPQHTLIAQQFSREQLEQLCTLATRIKRINKRRDGANFLKGLLSDKRAMLYFAQP